MSQKTQNKQQQLLIIIVLVICLLSYIISCTMQDMSTSLREETNVRLDKQPVNQSIKQNVAFYWDAEEPTALQIERAISYGGNEATEQIISNIEENIQYNRNKAAPLFYIAHAYAAIGKPEKAVETYNKLISSFNNHKIKLYILNTPRGAAENKTYSVSLLEEAKFRKALVKESATLLMEIADTTETFGVEGKEAFLYSDVIKKNINALYAKVDKKNTYEYYWRIYEAKEVALKFIALCLAENKDEALTEIKQMISLKQTNNLDAIIAKVKMLKDSKVELEYLTTKKEGTGYKYSFKIKENNIIIEVNDNTSFLNISDIQI